MAFRSIGIFTALMPPLTEPSARSQNPTTLHFRARLPAGEESAELTVTLPNSF